MKIVINWKINILPSNFLTLQISVKDDALHIPFKSYFAERFNSLVCWHVLVGFQDSQKPIHKCC